MTKIKNTFTTTYGIGEEVYYVADSGMCNNYMVEKGTIDRLNFGGKTYEMYEIKNRTFSEKALFKDLSLAKEAARQKAKDKCTRNIELIDEQEVKELAPLA